jgi:hypothetical protein
MQPTTNYKHTQKRKATLCPSPKKSNHHGKNSTSANRRPQKLGVSTSALSKHGSKASANRAVSPSVPWKTSSNSHQQKRSRISVAATGKVKGVLDHYSLHHGWKLKDLFELALLEWMHRRGWGIGLELKQCKVRLLDSEEELRRRLEWEINKGRRLLSSWKSSPKKRGSR